MSLHTLCVFLLLFQTARSASWHTVSTNPDYIGRGETAFAPCSPTKLCVLGGRGQSPVSILDTKTLSYSSGSEPPVELHHFQAFQGPDDCAWVVGAWTGPYPDEDNVDRIWKYCADSDQWQEGDTIARPRGSGGAFYWNGAVYLVSGNVGGHNVDAQLKPWFDKYDVATGKWSVLPDLPIPRDHFHVVRKGTAVYVAGGRDSTADAPAFFNDVEHAVLKFDLSSETWTRLPDFDRPRGGSFAALHDGQVFVMGGEGFDQAWDEVHVLQDETFNRIDDMPTRRHGAGAVSCNGVLWVAGGVPTQGGGTPNTDTVAYYDGDAPNACRSSVGSTSSATATPDSTKPPTTTAGTTTVIENSVTKPPTSAAPASADPPEPQTTVDPTTTVANPIAEASPLEDDGVFEPSNPPGDPDEFDEPIGTHTLSPTPSSIVDEVDYSPQPVEPSPTTAAPATTFFTTTSTTFTTAATLPPQSGTLTTVTSIADSTTTASTTESTTATTAVPVTSTPEPEATNSGTGQGTTTVPEPSPAESAVTPTKTPAPNTAVNPVASEEPIPTDDFGHNSPVMNADAGTPEPSQSTTSGAVGEPGTNASPQASAEASEDNSEPACFSSDNIVQLRDGTTKFMHQMRIGDFVKVAHPDEYSPVYFFSHHHVGVNAKAIRIFTSVNGISLSVSPTHLLYVNSRRAPAKDVLVGDKLFVSNDKAGQEAVVVAVKVVEAAGLHNPHTLQGDIVVNGIVASTFTSTVHPTLANILLAPFKAAYHVFGGHPAISRMNEVVLRSLDRYYWQRSGHSIVVHKMH